MGLPKPIRCAIAGALILPMLASAGRGRGLEDVVVQESGKSVRITVRDDFNFAPQDSSRVTYIGQDNPSDVHSDSTDANGEILWDDFYTGVSDNPYLPKEFKLQQNYPNPFNPSTVIPYSLKNYADVNLSIYNLKGELVKTLVDAKQDMGEYEERWDGSNNKGVGVAASQYVAVLSYGEGQQAIKMMLLDGTVTSGKGSKRYQNTAVEEGKWYDVSVEKEGYNTLTGSEFIFNEEGLQEIIHDIQRHNSAPAIVEFSVTPDVTKGDTIYLHAVVSDSHNDTYTVEWQVNGSSYFNLDAEHITTTAGNKTVSFNATDERGAARDTSTIVYVSEPDKVFQAVIVDNKTLDQVLNGVIEVNGVQHQTDGSGYVNVSIDPSIPQLDSVRAWSVSGDTASSFMVTYRNVPMDSSYSKPAGLMITTYDSLTNVEESLRVGPQLFRDFMQEGNFIGGHPYNFPAGLKSIDFENAQNPVPNPEGEHGYVYWIDSDYANRMDSNFGTLSQQEQLYIKEVIEREILANIKDPDHRPQIYLAPPGENPLLKQGGHVMNMDDGVLFVTHRIGRNGYQFSWDDYDDDGIIDAANIKVGDPTNIDEGISQEAGSIIIPGGIYNPDMRGRNINNEVYSPGFLTPADLKALGIEENVTTGMQWQVQQLPSGLDVARGYYEPLTHINDILRIPN